MANTKELLMRELSEDKETQLQKFAVFQNRIFRKEGYVKALENLMKLKWKSTINNDCDELERAELWVRVFEIEEKLKAQKQILSQHIRYLNELKRVSDEQDM